MTSRTSYRIQEAAKLSGVSVRTLHYYDDIGLLVPQRTESGYRVYGDAELLRLQQILIGRSLGLSLEQIRRSLDDPNFDRRQALCDQRAELIKRIQSGESMLRAIDHAIAIIDAEHGGDEMDRSQLFDGFDPSEHEDEAKRRWGHTEAYRESARRTKRYTAADWARLRDEHAAIYADAVALLRAGEPPDSDAAVEVAERYRLSIDRWFYPCSREMHSGLADLYEADGRFANNIDKHGEGLSAFLVEAIRANAAR